MTILARLVRSASGAAAAELALCLPMVMALMFGSFEGGNYLLTEHKIVKGVRDGARYAARLSHANYNCGTGAVNATAQTQIKEVTRTGRPSGGTVRVRGWSNTTVDVTLSCDAATNTGLYRDIGAAPRVLVSSVVPYPSLLGRLGFDTSGVVVRAQAEAAVMGV